MKKRSCLNTSCGVESPTLLARSALGLGVTLDSGVVQGDNVDMRGLTCQGEGDEGPGQSPDVGPGLAWGSRESSDSAV